MNNIEKLRKKHARVVERRDNLLSGYGGTVVSALENLITQYRLYKQAKKDGDEFEQHKTAFNAYHRHNRYVQQIEQLETQLRELGVIIEDSCDSGDDTNEDIDDESVDNDSNEDGVDEYIDNHFHQFFLLNFHQFSQSSQNLCFSSHRNN